ncbi:hypothetical protein HK099_003146 [Clydaea vesicula]|uniref:Pericentrin/AKAP-450 centrosomal targeting domain-containing protein n=1 Tax=Clydaea vesicula TaxID=447962 RepID=A0AAD5Y3Q3_9FUNG|nr:hypothetical protein HK099_003146 [Clydaea vesicula]
MSSPSARADKLAQAKRKLQKFQQKRNINPLTHSSSNPDIQEQVIQQLNTDTNDIPPSSLSSLNDTHVNDLVNSNPIISKVRNFDDDTASIASSFAVTPNNENIPKSDEKCIEDLNILNNKLSKENILLLEKIKLLENEKLIFTAEKESILKQNENLDNSLKDYKKQLEKLSDIQEAKTNLQEERSAAVDIKDFELLESDLKRISSEKENLQLELNQKIDLLENTDTYLHKVEDAFNEVAKKLTGDSALSLVISDELNFENSLKLIKEKIFEADEYNKSEILNLKTQLDQINIQVKENENYLNHTERILEENESLFQVQCKEFREQIEEKKAKIQVLQKSLTFAENSVDSTHLKNSILELEQKYTQSLEINSSLNERITEYETKLQESVAAVEELKNQNDLVKSEFASKIKDLEEKISEATSSLTEKCNEIVLLNEQIQTLITQNSVDNPSTFADHRAIIHENNAKEIAELRKAHSSLSEDYELLKITYEKNVEKIISTTTKSTTTTTYYSETSDEGHYEAISEDHNESLKNEIKELKLQLEALQLRSPTDDTKFQLRVHIEELENSLETSKIEIINLTKERNQLNENIEELLEKVDDLSQKYENTNRSFQNLFENSGEQIESLVKENSQHLLKIKSLEKLVQENVPSSEANGEDLFQGGGDWDLDFDIITPMNTPSSVIIEQYESKISELTQSTANLTSNLSETKSKLSQLETLQNTLVEKYDSEVKALKALNAEEKLKLENDFKQKEEQLKKETSKIEDLLESNGGLEDQLTTLELNFSLLEKEKVKNIKNFEEKIKILEESFNLEKNQLKESYENTIVTLTDQLNAVTFQLKDSIAETESKSFSLQQELGEACDARDDLASKLTIISQEYQKLNAYCSELQEKNDEIQLRLEELSGALTSTTSKETELITELEEKNVELLSLQEKVKALEENQIKTSNDMAVLVESFQEEMSPILVEKERLLKELSESTDALSEKGQEINMMEEKLKLLEDKLDESNLLIKKKDEKIIVIEKEILEIRNEKETIMKNLHDLNAELEEAKCKKNEVESLVQSNEEYIQSLGFELEKYKKNNQNANESALNEIKTLTLKISELTAVNEKNYDVMETQRLELREAREHVVNLEKEAQILEAEREELIFQNQKVFEKEKAFELNIKDYEFRLVECDEALGLLKRELDDERELLRIEKVNMAELTKQWQNEISDQKLKENKLVAQLRECSLEKEVALKNVAAISEKLSALIEERDSLEELKNTLENENWSLEEKNIQMNDKLKEAELTVKKFKDSYENLAAENITNFESAKKLRDELVQFEQEKTLLHETLKTLNSKIVELESDKEDLYVKIEEEKFLHEKLALEKEDLLSKINQIQETVGESIELKKQFDNILNEKTKILDEKEALAKSISSLNEELNKVQQKQLTHTSKLAAEISSLKEEIEFNNATIKIRDETIQELQELLSNEKKQNLQNFEELNEKNQLKISELESSIKSLQDARVEAYNKVEEVQKELALKIENLKESTSLYNNAMDDIEVLSKDLRDVTMEIEKLKSINLEQESKISEIDELYFKLDDLSSLADERLSQLEKSRNEAVKFEEENKRLVEEIENLKASIGNLVNVDKENKELKNEIENHILRNEEFTMNIANLSNELKSIKESRATIADQKVNGGVAQGTPTPNIPKESEEDIHYNKIVLENEKLSKELKYERDNNTALKLDIHTLVKTLEKLEREGLVNRNSAQHLAYGNSSEEDEKKNESLVKALRRELEFKDSEISKLYSEFESKLRIAEEKFAEFSKVGEKAISNTQYLQSRTVLGSESADKIGSFKYCCGHPDCHKNCLDNEEKMYNEEDNLSHLIEVFISTITEYQQDIADFMYKQETLLDSLKAGRFKSSRAIQEEIRLQSDHFIDIQLQYESLQKQITYVCSNTKRGEFVSQSGNYSFDSNERTPHQNNSSVLPEIRLSSEEYMDLTSRSSQANHLRIQFDNAQNLITELNKEIHVLKSAIETMTQTSHRKTGPVPEDIARMLLNKQIEELRKVWSHELSANNILRNLIAKTQKDSVGNSEEQSRREADLKEEIDELVSIIESTSKENKIYKQKIAEKEKKLNEVTKNSESKFSSSFLEYQENTSALDEIHHSEVEALSSLVKTLENERDSLISDFKLAKARFEEKLNFVSNELKRSQSQNEKIKSTVEGETVFLRKELKDVKLEKLAEQSRLQEAATKKSLEYERKLKDIEEILRERENNFNTEKKNLLERISELESRESLNYKQQGSFTDLEMLRKRDAERRLADREISWDVERRGLFEEIDRLKDAARADASALRYIRSQNENLEKLLVQRDFKIKKLESSTYVFPPYGSERSHSVDGSLRFQELERELQSCSQKNRTLLEEINKSDMARHQLENQIRVERDRSNRYSFKIEELQRQIYEIEQNYGREQRIDDEHLHNEITILKKELKKVQQHNQDITIILNETISSIIGETNEYKYQLDVSQFKIRAGQVIQEVIYLRALVNRLALQRADLQYQKIYLSLQVADLLSSQKVTLTYIKGMGISTQSVGGDLTIRKKFIRCVNVVITITRLRRLAKNWKDILQNNGRDLSDYLNIGNSSVTRNNIEAMEQNERLVLMLESEVGNLRAEKKEIQDMLVLTQSQKRILEAENLRLSKLPNVFEQEGKFEQEKKKVNERILKSSVGMNGNEKKGIKERVANTLNVMKESTLKDFKEFSNINEPTTNNDLVSSINEGLKNTIPPPTHHH